MSKHVNNIKSILGYNKKKLSIIKENLNSFNRKKYIVIYNPNNIGIMNSAIELFENTMPLSDLLNDKLIENIADIIIENQIEQIIFSSISIGWKNLAEAIKSKNKNIRIKFIWHGSHSLFVNDYEADFLYDIMELHNRNIIDNIAFAKESMAKYYEMKGYRTTFVKNNIKSIDINKYKKIDNNKDYNTSYNNKINLGIYSAGDRWEKNIFNQISGLSLIENSSLDCIPNTKLVKEFCDFMNIDLKSSEGYLKREDMLSKMALNDVNLYVTFTECSPMIPLESMEVGVPCITGNNHHYFKNTKLEKYLIVKSEDDIDEIAEKIKLVLENKNEILEIYKEWKKIYDEESKISVIDFLNN